MRDGHDGVDRLAQIRAPTPAQRLPDWRVGRDRPPFRLSRIACIAPAIARGLRASDFSSHVAPRWLRSHNQRSTADWNCSIHFETASEGRSPRQPGVRRRRPPWPKPAARPGTGSPPRPTGSPPSRSANGPPSPRRLTSTVTDDYELGFILPGSGGLRSGPRCPEAGRLTALDRAAQTGPQKMPPPTAASAHGGGRGIRTLDTVPRIHAFQACAFNHSATPPAPPS